MSLLKPSNYHEARLLAKAPALIERAIGKTVKVRSAKLPRNVTVSGSIIAAYPERFYYTARSVTLIFRVTVEAGANKAHHCFSLRSLPQ